VPVWFRFQVQAMSWPLIRRDQDTSHRSRRPTIQLLGVIPGCVRDRRRADCAARGVRGSSDGDRASREVGLSGASEVGGVGQTGETTGSSTSYLRRTTLQVRPAVRRTCTVGQSHSY
jgi:hypothetical protein